MKICPSCEQETVRYIDVVFKNLLFVRKKLVCLNCNNELITRIGFVSSLFISILDFIGLIAFVFFIISFMVNIFSIKYFGITVISIGLKIGVMTFFPINSIDDLQRINGKTCTKVKVN